MALQPLPLHIPGNVAVCFHGRAVDESVTRKLLDAWAPLNADYFATISNDASAVGNMSVPTSEIPLGAEGWLNSTGRLVFMESTLDESETQMKEDQQHGSWKWVNPYCQVRSYRDPRQPPPLTTYCLLLRWLPRSL